MKNAEFEGGLVPYWFAAVQVKEKEMPISASETKKEAMPVAALTTSCPEGG